MPGPDLIHGRSRDETVAVVKFESLDGPAHRGRHDLRHRTRSTAKPFSEVMPSGRTTRGAASRPWSSRRTAPGSSRSPRSGRVGRSVRASPRASANVMASSLRARSTGDVSTRERIARAPLQRRHGPGAQAPRPCHGLSTALETVMEREASPPSAKRLIRVMPERQAHRRPAAGRSPPRSLTSACIGTPAPGSMPGKFARPASTQDGDPARTIRLAAVAQR